MMDMDLHDSITSQQRHRHEVRAEKRRSQRLAATAADPATSTEALTILARRHPSTNPKMAHNPSCPKHVLKDLATHEEARVRRAVAYNPATTAHVLRTLCQDADGTVSAAAERQLAVRHLPAYAEVSAWSPQQRETAAADPATDGKTLTVLAAYDVRTRQCVAANPNTPVDVLTALSADAKKAVRRNVAMNPTTSMPALALLSGDIAPAVRLAVTARQDFAVTAIL